LKLILFLILKTIKIIIEEYIHRCLSAESDVLTELYRQTHLKVPNGGMISGHEQGRLLSMFSHMIAPKNILEIGTFTGYSAICLAEGLAPNGKLHTIEQNDELRDFALSFFEKAGMSDKIVQYTGDALDIIPTFHIMFDLVFIDAAKNKYMDYYQSVLDKVCPNGYILIDNILWYDKVADNSCNDKKTNALRDFNAFVGTDLRVEKAIVQNRDGLFILRKRVNSLNNVKQ
jgi:predicted O-methyltransferase YrrM